MYSVNVNERAEQLASNKNVAIKAQRPVSLKYIIDVELLESNIDCEFIGVVDSYDEDCDDENCESISLESPNILKLTLRFLQSMTCCLECYG